MKAPLWQGVLLLLIMGAIIGAVYWAISTYWLPPTPANIAIAAAIGVVYLIVCYFVSPPEPDMDEFTWWDNPFSISDDINRYRLAVMVTMVSDIVIVHSAVAVLQTMRA